MTVKAITGLVPEWYTPNEQKEEAEPAQFHLKPLTAPQIAKVQSSFNLDDGSIDAEGLYEAASMALIGWRGVEDHEGNTLPFSKRGIDNLPYAIILELGGQALANSFLTDDDTKN